MLDIFIRLAHKKSSRPFFGMASWVERQHAAYLARAKRQAPAVADTVPAKRATVADTVPTQRATVAANAAPTVTTIPLKLSWVEQYRPQSMRQVVGHTKAKEVIAQWCRAPHPYQPLLIVGPVGAGKTSLAHAVCADQQWQVMEANALGCDMDMLTELLDTQKQGSGTAVIVDELECMTLGERSELINVIKRFRRTQSRIVIIAHDATLSLAPLKAMCTTVRLYTPHKSQQLDLVSRLSTLEHASFPRQVVECVLECTRGDLRKLVVRLEMESKMQQRQRTRILHSGTHAADIFVPSLFDAASCVLADAGGAGRHVAEAMFQQHDLMTPMLFENYLKAAGTMLEHALAFSDMDVLQSHSAHATHDHAHALLATSLYRRAPAPRWSFPQHLHRPGFSTKLRDWRMHPLDWQVVGGRAAQDAQIFSWLATHLSVTPKELKKVVHGLALTCVPDLLGDGGGGGAVQTAVPM